MHNARGDERANFRAPRACKKVLARNKLRRYHPPAGSEWEWETSRARAREAGYAFTYRDAKFLKRRGGHFLTGKKGKKSANATANDTGGIVGVSLDSQQSRIYVGRRAIGNAS